MSQKLLEALMQLFAIVADVNDIENASRSVVESFLKQRLNAEAVAYYLKQYDEYLEKHHKISKGAEGARKKTSVNSVKVLRICTEINKELEQRQKVIVLLRLTEYLYSQRTPNEQEIEFLSTVADTFNIPDYEAANITNFIKDPHAELSDHANLLVISQAKEQVNYQKIKTIIEPHLDQPLCVLYIASVQFYALKYYGIEELFLNGQPLRNDRVYILNQGSSIRSTKVPPIYYSDISSKFLMDINSEKIDFIVDTLEYEFPGGKKGLHTLTLKETSGNLIGIMGGSGSGKSTLLNILNGNYKPSKGSVTINGIDIHNNPKEIEGVIGYISQDDLLIEDLTVFENLYFNAQLCFKDKAKPELIEQVNALLKSLGLFEAKDLKVGNPIDKKISGGQRKRLNCALELIREPSVLFVDEPTSGLSSRDSENIMDLLKELALKGKLIFVVIHQPSSDIYKMFDKLMIMDMGGYPIYYGNPLDAVIYFKTMANALRSEESECLRCGNVNPEQVFNIIEQKVVDEYGNHTDKRKMQPNEWNAFFADVHQHNVNEGDKKVSTLPENTFKKPNLFNQFLVFAKRDVLSKVNNSQYLVVNFLEAPILAVILAYFTRYYTTDVSNMLGYTYYGNDNIPAFIFISVVVSLFLGLTVSAEEIIKDQKIRKREQFLNLSNFSYLGSKVLIMFAISAIQVLSFVLVGNTILDINGMYFDYWLVLFSAACFANVLGLNISASFKNAVTIYILIPFLIIPQLLFSGVIVAFDKLNPTITSQQKVPVIGEIMASRWAFEALAVNQFVNNDYESEFYTSNKRISIANYKKNFWIPNLKEKVNYLEAQITNKEDSQIKHKLLILKNEITKENNLLPDMAFARVENLTIDNLNDDLIYALQIYLNDKEEFYKKVFKINNQKRDNRIYELSKELGKEEFNKLRNDYVNEGLSDLVSNKNELSKILELDEELVQKADPIYLDAETPRAHFYAPRKKIFGTYVTTFTFNILVIWAMTLALMVTLYMNALSGFFKLVGGVFKLAKK